MTAYAFTGPTRLTSREREAAQETVRLLTAPSVIITGGADGWDMSCAWAAIDYWPVRCEHRIYYPAAVHADDQVQELCEAARKLRGIEVKLVCVGDPDDPPAVVYRARNEAMVYAADTLVAGLRKPKFYRSGEWMTVNIARRFGRAVIPVDLGRA